MAYPSPLNHDLNMPPATEDSSKSRVDASMMPLSTSMVSPAASSCFWNLPNAEIHMRPLGDPLGTDAFGRKKPSDDPMGISPLAENFASTTTHGSQQSAAPRVSVHGFPGSTDTSITSPGTAGAKQTDPPFLSAFTENVLVTMGSFASRRCPACANPPKPVLDSSTSPFM